MFNFAELIAGYVVKLILNKLEVTDPETQAAALILANKLVNNAGAIVNKVLESHLEGLKRPHKVSLP